MQDPLTHKVIACAIEVHKTLGPGLLESIYEICLSVELTKANLPHTRQQKRPIIYKGQLLDLDFRADIIIENTLILEVKSVQQRLPIHEAQLLTYLKISNLPTGLLLNFNETVLKNGIRRRLNT
jgi:GxxExxY protein